MSVHASVEDQKDQRFVLQAAPFETVSMLLEKAVKRFNRTLGPGKEHAVHDNCILKVCNMLLGRSKVMTCFASQTQNLQSTYNIKGI